MLLKRGMIVNCSRNASLRRVTNIKFQDDPLPSFMFYEGWSLRKLWKYFGPSRAGLGLQVHDDKKCVSQASSQVNKLSTINEC